MASWWKTQPVFPKNNQKPYTKIDNIPKPIFNSEFIIYKYNINYINAILEFINSNYIDGYEYSLDYLHRKTTLHNSTSLVLMNTLNEIVGFITCQPIQFQNIEMGYVDLMTVSKKYRSKGLAKILISHIVNYSGFDSYLHKKDSCPLPFPYFFKDKYWSIPLAVLKYRYKLDKNNISLTQNDRLETISNYNKNGFLIEGGFFRNSESIKNIVLNDGSYVSFAIHKFTYGILRNVKLAEIFATTLGDFNKEVYLELIKKLLNFSIDFLVVLESQTFFRSPIKLDNFLGGRELYLHSYNRYIPSLEEGSDFQIPVF